MKKIYSFICFVLVMTVAGTSLAHVFPTAYPGYHHYPLPKYEYYYIRIIPSPVLEGFASYELCPLMQDENKDKYLIQSEKQKLGAGNYHHDLINPNCERPYQLNPLSPPVYFDLRDLDRILSHDDEKVKVKLIGEAAVGLVTFYFTAGTLTPVLWGWFSLEGTASAIIVSEVTNKALSKAYPTPSDRLSQTQVRYFTGVQAAEGTDMYWPILPAEVQTYGECRQSCNAEKTKIENEIKSNQKKSNPYYIELDMAQHSETTNSMNPLNGVNSCDLQCRGYPTVRTSMRKIWKDLYLDTIYQTGHEPYRDRYPNRNDKELDSKQRYERYHIQKHMDWSAWTTAVEDSGKLIPNHYTHKGNVNSTIIFGGHDIHYLCDYVRTKAFENYKKTNPQITFGQWFNNKCHFDQRTQCREYFEGPVQTGNEICTVLSE